jgi:acyl-CoA reductase-like NAD-dependent aldehyde dehydrogenase
MVRREPVGVVAAITPWNYPLAMAIWKLAPALASGNTVVLKPSDLTPLTALRLAGLSADILPPGVLNVVCGGGATTGRQLVRHPAVRMVSLTGSPETGRMVARDAATHLTRVQLELGGKAPAIVLDDADVDAVVPALTTAAFSNSGQDCTAATRVLATPGVFDELVARLCDATAQLRVGPPLEPGVEMGPLVSGAHRERVVGFIDRALNDGGQLLTGGESFGPGAYLRPAILIATDQHAEIVQREVFGPVLIIQRVRDEAHALGCANDVPYGLAASVWTTGASAALRLARELECGVVWINEHGVGASEMPHGGRRESGYGTHKSAIALSEYTTVKHVMASLATAC